MIRPLDSVTIKQIEKIVLERIAIVGRVPAIDQLATITHKKSNELAELPKLSPAYAALVDLKPKYIAQLAARLQAFPAHFPNLQSAADYIVGRAETAEIEEIYKRPDNDPEAA